MDSAGDQLTARLDLNSIETDAVDTSLVIKGPLFQDLPAGESQLFSVSGFADAIGSYLTDFIFHVADEAIPGSASSTVQLQVTYEVIDLILLGDVNGDGTVNLLDVGLFADLIGSGQFDPRGRYQSGRRGKFAGCGPVYRPVGWWVAGLKKARFLIQLRSAFSVAAVFQRFDHIMETHGEGAVSD